MNEFMYGIKNTAIAGVLFVSMLAAVFGGSVSSASSVSACDKSQSADIETLVCEDAELSDLDRRLADVYKAVTENAADDQQATLKVEQVRWVKERNDCRKSNTKRECVRQEYLRRIAELQATYRLVAATGPFTFACDDAPRDEVSVTYFETEPKTLIAERGDSVSLMYVQPSGSGARYQGRNESFWEHQGEALVVWGLAAPQMHCKRVR